MLGSVLLSGIPITLPNLSRRILRVRLLPSPKLGAGLCRENLGACPAQTQAPCAGHQLTLSSFSRKRDLDA